MLLTSKSKNKEDKYEKTKEFVVSIDVFFSAS